MWLIGLMLQTGHRNNPNVHSGRGAVKPQENLGLSMNIFGPYVFKLSFSKAFFVTAY